MNESVTNIFKMIKTHLHPEDDSTVDESIPSYKQIIKIGFRSKKLISKNKTLRVMKNNNQ